MSIHNSLLTIHHHLLDITMGIENRLQKRSIMQRIVLHRIIQLRHLRRVHLHQHSLPNTRTNFISLRKFLKQLLPSLTEQVRILGTTPPRLNFLYVLWAKSSEILMQDRMMPMHKIYDTLHNHPRFRLVFRPSELGGSF